MTILRYAVVSVILAAGAVTQTPDQQNEARQAVRSFYDAFNAHSFENAETYTTEDWNHVNPLGGWARGREAVLTELREAHSTFLRGASVTVEDMTVRFATPDVAVVTVAGRGNSSQHLME